MYVRAGDGLSFWPYYLYVQLGAERPVAVLHLLSV